MKKYLVIGNPIEHSLSPKLHNYWIKENNINAIYDKKLLDENNIQEVIEEVKNEKIHGINVTVPFKKSVIPFLDQLSPLAKEVQSVNTIFKKDNKVIGENTDVGGFKQSLEYINYNVKNKKVFILGAGGVVSSILKALEKLGAAKVYISNRTKEKAKNLESHYKISLGLETLDWGQSPDFDIIINATSLGLKNNEKIELDYNKHKSKFFGKKKLFYDVIYNPEKTNFLLKGEELGNETTNGKMMFICQAQLAFKIWHNILPKIDNETIKLLGGSPSVSLKF